MFKATIITPNRTLYEGEAWSVFLPGATGEFEVLDFHKAIISLLKAGRIIIDWDKEIPIKSGAMRMSDDEFVAIVEE
jgi:F-type H+-transporting ATPase subunit epsilon